MTLSDLPLWLVIGILVYVGVLLTIGFLRGQTVHFWPPRIEARTRPGKQAGKEIEQVTPRPSTLPKLETSPGTLVLLGSETRDADKNNVIRKATKYVGDSGGDRPPWFFHEIKSLKDLDDEGLVSWKGIFLAIPYGQRFNDKLTARLTTWVRNGGRLVVTGYELGERHHRTNLNQLTYHFGFAFNSDVIVGPESSGVDGGKGYDLTLTYNEVVDKEHPLFRNIRKIALKNTCSLHLEPGASPLLLAHPNRVLELQNKVASYSKEGDFFVLATGDQRFNKPYEDTRKSVIALAPKDLTGKGHVLAMGTWDFRSDGLENNNDSFLQNLWRWMVD